MDNYRIWERLTTDKVATMIRYNYIGLMRVLQGAGCYARTAGLRDDNRQIQQEIRYARMKRAELEIGRN
jgi:hypothetical protein